MMLWPGSASVQRCSCSCSNALQAHVCSSAVALRRLPTLSKATTPVVAPWLVPQLSVPSANHPTHQTRQLTIVAAATTEAANTPRRRRQGRRRSSPKVPRQKKVPAQDGSIKRCLQQIEQLAEPAITEAITDEQVQAVDIHNESIEAIRHKLKEHAGANVLAFECGTWLEHPARNAGFQDGSSAYGVIVLWPLEGGRNQHDYTIYEMRPNGLLSGQMFYNGSEFEELTSHYTRRRFLVSAHILGDNMTLKHWLKCTLSTTDASGAVIEPASLIRKARKAGPNVPAKKQGTEGTVAASKRELVQNFKAKKQAGGGDGTGPKPSEGRKKRVKAAGSVTAAGGDGAGAQTRKGRKKRVQAARAVTAAAAAALTAAAAVI